MRTSFTSRLSSEALKYRSSRSASQVTSTAKRPICAKAEYIERCESSARPSSMSSTALKSASSQSSRQGLRRRESRKSAPAGIRHTSTYRIIARMRQTAPVFAMSQSRSTK